MELEDQRRILDKLQTLLNVLQSAIQERRTVSLRMGAQLMLLPGEHASASMGKQVGIRH